METRCYFDRLAQAHIGYESSTIWSKFLGSCPKVLGLGRYEAFSIASVALSASSRAVKCFGSSYSLPQNWLLVEFRTAAIVCDLFSGTLFSGHNATSLLPKEFSSGIDGTAVVIIDAVSIPPGRPPFCPCSGVGCFGSRACGQGDPCGLARTAKESVKHGLLFSSMHQR